MTVDELKAHLDNFDPKANVVAIVNEFDYENDNIPIESVYQVPYSEGAGRLPINEVWIDLDL